MSIHRALKLLAGLALFAQAASADSPAPQAGKLAIFATDWGLTLKGDGSGFYNELARYILEGTSDVSTYTILPYRRAKSSFLHAKAACLYPSNIQLLKDGGEIEDATGLIETHSFLRVKVFLFSRPGTTPPASLADVNDKAVAYAMGSRVPYFLRHATADYIAVADEVAKAQMLLSGRVDLMSAAMPDAKFVFDKLGAPLAPHDTNYMLNDTAVRITCHDTEATRALIARLNTRIDALIASGELKAFMESKGLDGAVYTPAAE
jgi:ABC-type amino acid transport substrate-binding protein